MKMWTISLYKRKVFILCSAAAIIVCIALMLPLFAPNIADNIPVIVPDGSFLSVNTSLSVSAKRAVLIEAESGEVLYGKAHTEKAGMASTTKIMTALVAIENCNTEESFVIPREAAAVEGSSIYLVEGEKLTVSELLYGLMLESGNDCAVALAIACSGSVEAFVDEMNKKVRELGITDTNFTNPHGLSDDEHYTSAYSLALITAEAMKNELFREIVSTEKKYISYNGKEKQRYLSNHNRLLRSYDGAVGVKTGFTKATGRCLVSAATRDGMTLIAVTLNDGNDWNTHASMLDYGFESYERIVLAPKEGIRYNVPVVGGKSENAEAVNNEEFSILAARGTVLTQTVTLPHFLYAPVHAGDVLGYITWKTEDNENTYTLCLYAAQSIEYKKISLFKKIFGKE